MAQTTELRTVVPEPEPEPETASTGDHGDKGGGISRNDVLRLLRGAQRYSAYGFSVFAAMHVTTTLVLPQFSVAEANSSLTLFRSIYQSPVGEATLIYGSLGIHVLSGWALHAYRVYRTRREYGIWRLGGSRVALSGSILTPMVLAHFFAQRVAPVRSLGDGSLISLDYITWCLQNYTLQTGVSLFALVLVFTYHAVSGWSMLQRIKLGYKRVVALAVAAALTVSSLTILYKQPPPIGWLAAQFRQAHSALDRLLGGH